ncbi:BALF1 [macacine gammaherpesvirus 10]|uniref:BALF1 n=1 Tax=macacine gammaherpesvirus 10 TaxID=2560569 RepID=A0A0S0DWX8_9GAMA|nr:BALF1 [macacine gammaherpesvirus 10]ALF03273.1 BALF1 [macacine gammaherpesvirus 10]
MQPAKSTDSVFVRTPVEAWVSPSPPDDKVAETSYLLFRAMYAVFTQDETDLPLPALVMCRLLKASLRKHRRMYAELACKTADLGGKHAHMQLIISVLRAVYDDHYDYWSRLRVVLCYTVVFAVRNYLDDHDSAAFVMGATAHYLALYRRLWFASLGGLPRALRRQFPVTWTVASLSTFLKSL